MKTFSFETLQKFHDTFKGDTTITFPVCLECGGVCEYKKISSLLPGEAEFMAFKKGEPLEQFRNKYLDGFRFKGQVIDIIKCIPKCPLMNADYSCGARGFKPIMCLIYPIIFKRENDKYIADVDDYCPLIMNPKTSKFFREDGIKLVEQLGIDDEWIDIDYIFDEYNYNYDKMLADRNVPAEEYKIYELDEILSYRELDE